MPQHYMLAQRMYENAAARVSELNVGVELENELRGMLARFRAALDAVSGLYGLQPHDP